MITHNKEIVSIFITLKNSKLLGIFLLLAACSQENKTANPSLGLSLLKENDTLHYLQIKTDSTENQWELPYPVYQFKIGDINEDGIDDMLVGVIKTTRFDSENRKRLFIFKNYKGLVRPLWLGSRLGKPLVDFTFTETPEGARVRSIEEDLNGKFLIAEYRWKKFGLSFTKYIAQGIDMNKARTYLE